MKNLALTETHRLPASWTRNSASPPAMNPRLLTFRVLTRGCFPAKKHPAIFMWRQGATEKSAGQPAPASVSYPPLLNLEPRSFRGRPG